MSEELEPPDRSRPDSETIGLAALGMMTRGIVHDLGNLMQVVGSAIRLIEQKLDVTTRATVSPFIQGALQSVERAAELSRQILGVARPDRAAEDVVHLDAALAAIERPICWTAGPGIRVELAVEDDLPAVSCDVRDFERAMLNLVVNAKDAMPGGGHLFISARRGNFGDGGAVLLRVTDTGCGMSAETAERAGQPLFTTKPPGRGNGLGLAMVSEFARRAGGSVQIESTVNRGTRITLRLPTRGG